MSRVDARWAYIRSRSESPEKVGSRDVMREGEPMSAPWSTTRPRAIATTLQRPVAEEVPPRCCVILGAGSGSRLAVPGGVKPLVPVLGLPLLERTIVTACEAGLSRFFVVTGCQAPRVEAFLSGLAVRRNLAISAIRNEAWEAGNASSLLAARHVLQGNFLLLVADHIFDPAILSRLLEQQLQPREIVVAVDELVGKLETERRRDQVVLANDDSLAPEDLHQWPSSGSAGGAARDLARGRN
jgi:hypothetical protein